MRRSVAAILAPVIVLLWAPPASAAGDSIEVEDGLYSDSCTDVGYIYTLDTVNSAYYKDVAIAITVTDRFGGEVGYAYDTGGYGGYDILSICAKKSGTFDVVTEIYGCNYQYDCRTFPGPSTTFRLKKPNTRTELTASPTNTHRNQVVTFRILRRQEYSPGSYRPESGYVSLQVLRANKWATVRASHTFAYRGHANLKYRVPGSLLKVRAASIQPGFEISYSRPVTLR